MYNQVFPYDGDCCFSFQYNGDVLDTAAGLDSWILQPRREYPRYCYFKVGYTGLVDGVLLVGATSLAVIKVGHVALTGGVLGSTTGTGVLFFSKVSGTIVSGENLQIGGTGTVYAVTVSGQLNAPLTMASAVSLDVETNSIRYTLGGVAPTNAVITPTNFGVLLAAGLHRFIAGSTNVRNLQMIHAASGSNAVVNVEVFFIR